MDQLASWIATIATITAACFTASNLGSRITGIGFIIFTVGSIAWLATGALTGQPALLWTNVVMTLLNSFGVYRWLGRQAKLEEGAEKASEKSRAMDSETLFPASTLSAAKLLGRDGQPLGTLVDAMIGCGSGRLSYLVVAEGGVAGVGETIRRVDWRGTSVHDSNVTSHLDPGAFACLPELPRDNWPGR